MQRYGFFPEHQTFSMEIFQFNINLQAKLTCVKARDRHTLLYINIGTGKSEEAQEKAERGMGRLREGKLRQGHG